MVKIQRSAAVPAEREAAHNLSEAHSAIENIAFLSIFLFILVCVAQAGWSCYLLMCSGSDIDWTSYNSGMSSFSAAGMVASAGAIYNVHIVESTFHQYLEGYQPLLKFITVKLLVSFAWFQKGAFSVLKGMDKAMPNVVQTVLRKVPVLNDILDFSDAKFEMFYDSLLVYECVLIALLHWWAWGAKEAWYRDEDDSTEEATEGEKQPLMADASAA